MLTFGSMLIIGGSAVTGLGIGVTVDGSPGWGVLGLTTGIASIGVGIGLTVAGVQRKRRYRDWQTTSGLRPPLKGGALLAAGTATMFGSGGVIAISTAGGLPDSWIPAGLALGSAGMGVGVLLIFVGATSNVEFDRWRHDRVRMQPTASLGPRGMLFGLSGRF